MDELATIDTQFYEDLTFEDCNSIPIKDSGDTTEGAATTGVEIENPGVEI